MPQYCNGQSYHSVSGVGILYRRGEPDWVCKRGEPERVIAGKVNQTVLV